MKSSTLTATICALATSMCATAALADEPTPAPGLPDLTIQSISAALGTTCDLSGPVVTVTVLVANVGDAPSPARADAGGVVATDRYYSWTAGVALPDLAPGATATLNIPFLATEPDKIIGLHRFSAIVNPDHKIHETDYKNNGSSLVNLVIPKSLCAPGT